MRYTDGTWWSKLAAPQQKAWAARVQRSVTLSFADFCEALARAAMLLEVDDEMLAVAGMIKSRDAESRHGRHHHHKHGGHHGHRHRSHGSHSSHGSHHSPHHSPESRSRGVRRIGLNVRIEALVRKLYARLDRELGRQRGLLEVEHLNDRCFVQRKEADQQPPPLWDFDQIRAMHAPYCRDKDGSIIRDE